MILVVDRNPEIANGTTALDIKFTSLHLRLGYSGLGTSGATLITDYQYHPRDQILTTNLPIPEVPLWVYTPPFLPAECTSQQTPGIKYSMNLFQALFLLGSALALGTASRIDRSVSALIEGPRCGKKPCGLHKHHNNHRRHRHASASSHSSNSKSMSLSRSASHSRLLDVAAHEIVPVVKEGNSSGKNRQRHRRHHRRRCGCVCYWCYGRLICRRVCRRHKHRRHSSSSSSSSYM
jgi:hypothetical protein